jgi:hypothetical protein
MGGTRGDGSGSGWLREADGFGRADCVGEGFAPFSLLRTQPVTAGVSASDTPWRVPVFLSKEIGAWRDARGWLGEWMARACGLRGERFAPFSLLRKQRVVAGVPASDAPWRVPVFLSKEIGAWRNARGRLGRADGSGGRTARAGGRTARVSGWLGSTARRRRSCRRRRRGWR